MRRALPPTVTCFGATSSCHFHGSGGHHQPQSFPFSSLDPGAVKEPCLVPTFWGDSWCREENGGHHILMLPLSHTTGSLYPSWKRNLSPHVSCPREGFFFLTIWSQLLMTPESQSSSHHGSLWWLFQVNTPRGSMALKNSIPFQQLFPGCVPCTQGDLTADRSHTLHLCQLRLLLCGSLEDLWCLCKHFYACTVSDGLLVPSRPKKAKSISLRIVPEDYQDEWSKLIFIVLLGIEMCVFI